MELEKGYGAAILLKGLKQFFRNLCRNYRQMIPQNRKEMQ